MFLLLIGRLTADDFITPDAANKGKQHAKSIYQLPNLLTVRWCWEGSPVCTNTHRMCAPTGLQQCCLIAKLATYPQVAQWGSWAAERKRRGGGHHLISQRAIRHKVTASPCSSDGQSRRKAFHRRRVYPAPTASYPQTQRSCNLHYVRIRHCWEKQFSSDEPMVIYT